MGGGQAAERKWRGERGTGHQRVGVTGLRREEKGDKRSADVGGKGKGTALGKTAVCGMIMQRWRDQCVVMLCLLWVCHAHQPVPRRDGAI